MSGVKEIEIIRYRKPVSSGRCSGSHRTMTRAAGTVAAFASLLAAAHCFRILAVETVPGKSHWNFMSAALRALTDGGHHVTVFTPFPDGDRENYTEVDMSGTYPTAVGMDLMQLKAVLGAGVAAMMSFAMAMGAAGCTAIHGTDRMKAIAAAGRGLRADFDAIIVEPMMPDCVTYLAAASGLPLIFTVPLPVIGAADLELVGHVPNPAAVAPLMADHAVPRTFAQRFSNAVFNALYTSVLIALIRRERDADHAKPHYMNTIAIKPSLVFMNSHFITDASQPLPPNVVNVGGIHLKPVGQTPKDILKFIEESPHGVILFTFGSTVLMSTIPENIQRAIFEVLAQLPQRVLLKYENEMKDKPKNVMIKKWLPQREILMHPNVKLFISHGGISGIYEAVDASVPVLGFPLFGDQYRNVDNLVEAGMAISMDLLTVTKEAFSKNVVALLNDKKYTENAKIALEIFKDRPMTPEKSVVYWTEYVIRHKGAAHLKSQGLNLTWYQYLLLDVIAVMLIIVFIVLFIIYKIFKIVHGYISKCFHNLVKTKSE